MTFIYLFFFFKFIFLFYFILFYYIFFFCSSLLKTTEICFVLGVPKWEFSTGKEKTFHAGKNIRKNGFAPLRKYACYAPEWNALNSDSLFPAS